MPDAFDEKALAHQKPCHVCQEPRDVLVRCQIDDTGRWYFVCPKAGCWKAVSGGKVDGDDRHMYYRYGGMWKNKYAGVSAKMPKKKKGKGPKGEKGPEKGGEEKAGEGDEATEGTGEDGIEGGVGVRSARAGEEV